MAVGVALVLLVLTRITAPVHSQKRGTADLPSNPAVQVTLAPTAAPAAKAAPRAAPAKKAAAAPASVKAQAEESGLKPLDLAANHDNDQALTVRAEANCWLVVQVDGKRMPVVILAADEKKVWYFKQRLVMLAGNAGAVKAWWRGDSLGKLGAAGERKNGLVFEEGQPMREIAAANLELPSGVAGLQPVALQED
jgi:hypothetical protein